MAIDPLFQNEVHTPHSAETDLSHADVLGNSAPPAEGGLDAANEAGPGRRAERQSIFMVGEVRFGHMTAPQRVKIRNLSEGGAMVDSPLPARQGEAAIVTLPNIGPVRGRVAWVNGNRFGIEFSDKVDPHQVRRTVVVTKPEPEFLGQPIGMGQGRPGFKR